MILAEDEQVVEALGAHAAQEALAERVRVRRSDGRAQDLDAGRLSHAVESRAELVVVVADQEARALTPRRRLAELLGHPRVEGERVTPTCTTRREPSSMKKNAKSGRKSRS